MENKYNAEWFKKRAFSSIQPIKPHVWDYSDSLLLYISSSVQEYESLQAESTLYFNLVTKPEREYLKSIAQKVTSLLPENFEYVDLGPGTEHKEQFFFDELKKQGKIFTYIPVDISQHYLELASKHASDQGVSVHPIQSAFEEVAEILGEPTIPRFVNMGLTFSNYYPQVALDLLKRIAGNGGYVFVNSQMRNRVDMAELQKAYAQDALILADDKIRLLGLDPDKDVAKRETNDKIEVWSSIFHVTPKLKELGVCVGDKVLLFESLRYTPEQLEEELKKASNRYVLFDVGASFIAALIQT